jgi:hypothetical protein
MRILSAPQARMGQRRRGWAAGLKRISPVPKPGGGWASGSCCEGSGEALAPRCVMPPGIGKQRRTHASRTRTPRSLSLIYLPRPSESGPVHGLP